MISSNWASQSIMVIHKGEAGGKTIVGEKARRLLIFFQRRLRTINLTIQELRN